MQHTYKILLNKADVGGYNVSVPAFTGCITRGDTMEEALAMAKEAYTYILKKYNPGENKLPTTTIQMNTC